MGHLVDLYWHRNSLFVYFGAVLIASSLLIMVGLTGYKDWMSRMLPLNIWYIISALLAPVGFINYRPFQPSSERGDHLWRVAADYCLPYLSAGSEPGSRKTQGNYRYCDYYLCFSCHAHGRSRCQLVADRCIAIR